LKEKKTPFSDRKTTKSGSAGKGNGTSENSEINHAPRKDTIVISAVNIIT
jgi:hypothetical protein